MTPTDRGEVTRLPVRVTGPRESHCETGERSRRRRDV